MFMVNLLTVFYIQLERGVKHFCTHQHVVLVICKNVTSTNGLSFIAFIITSFPDLKGRTDTGVSTKLLVGNKKGVIGMTSSVVFFILIFVKFGHLFHI